MHDKQTARAEREIIQRDAIRLAAGAGVDTERTALVSTLCAHGRVRYDADDTVSVEYKSIHGDWHVDGATVVREMMSDPDFAKWFGRPLAAQSKPSQPREPNPFRRGADFNLTEQCKLLRSNPARAAALKAEANEEASQ